MALCVQRISERSGLCEPLCECVFHGSPCKFDLIDTVGDIGPHGAVSSVINIIVFVVIDVFIVIIRR